MKVVVSTLQTLIQNHLHHGETDISIFDNVPLRDILQELGRYYNVSIDCNSSNLLNYRMRFIIQARQ